MSAVSGSIDSCRSLENDKWRAVARFSEDNYLMCRTVDGVIRYAPLYFSTFRLHSMRVQTDEPDFINQHESHLDFETVPERIRWCRQKRGLMQKEVAELLGVSRTVYISYETGTAGYYPKEIVDKLAALFQIDVFDLLDDYNRFQYKGQGRAISQSRRLMGLSKKAYARMLGIDSGTLNNWEKDKKRMNRSSWEKLFKELLEE